MPQWVRVLSSWGLSVAVIGGVGGCAAKAPTKAPAAPQAYEETPVPTVPRRTPTPEQAVAPLPTRPVGKDVKARKGGRAIGPVITFFGAARADGSVVDPTAVDKNGIPTYTTSAGSGFILIVEAQPGESGQEVARRVFAYVPGDPTVRPDLEIESNRELGNGSRDVCDRRKPLIGGIPAVNPQNFAENQRVSDAINDFGCRFETFIESDSSCTMNKNGDYAFLAKETTTQFCMMVAKAWGFPEGETLLTVRLRDVGGNPGPTKQVRIKRPRPRAAAK